VQLEAGDLEMVEQEAEKLDVVIRFQLAPVAGLDAGPGVPGNDHDPLVGPRPDRTARPQADGGVQGLRAIVKEIQRPDVERAAGEVDARRR
jgi:hypothetical protein